jgi:hypothetical protein
MQWLRVSGRDDAILFTDPSMTIKPIRNMTLVRFTLIATAVFLVYYSIYGITLLLSSSCPAGLKSKAAFSICSALLLALLLIYFSKKIGDEWKEVQDQFKGKQVSEEEFEDASATQYWASQTLSISLGAILMVGLVFFWMKNSTLKPLEEQCTLDTGGILANIRDYLKSLEKLFIAIAGLLMLSLLYSFTTWRSLRSVEKADEEVSAQEVKEEREGRKHQLRLSRQQRINEIHAARGTQAPDTAGHGYDDIEEEKPQTLSSKVAKSAAENAKLAKNTFNSAKTSLKTSLKTRFSKPQNESSAHETRGFDEMISGDSNSSASSHPSQASKSSPSRTGSDQKHQEEFFSSKSQNSFSNSSTNSSTKTVQHPPSASHLASTVQHPPSASHLASIVPHPPKVSAPQANTVRRPEHLKKTSFNPGQGSVLHPGGNH